MKPWQINRKVGNLTREFDDSAKSETRIDINCLTEPERKLFDRVQEIIDKYAPSSPPQDVIEKNTDLWYKGLEIFGRRTTELFVDVVPASFCCDELEEWYFKVYFYNFWLDWMESIKELRNMPKEQRIALLVELLWQLKNDGRQPNTLCSYRKYLMRLLNGGADLFNPERTKEVLAQATLKDNTKRTVVGILETWFQFDEIKWKAPKYSRNPEIPYIPNEQELDLLIAACGKKISTYLHLLKETGARCGEISSLKWTSIDPQQKNVGIKAEKGSNPRILPLSQKALDMLNNMPKTSERIFAKAESMRTNFFIQRKTNRKKTCKPPTDRDTLSHSAALESNNGTA